jgi:hypothetical protein
MEQQILELASVGMPKEKIAKAEKCPKSAIISIKEK